MLRYGSLVNINPSASYYSVDGGGGSLYLLHKYHYCHIQLLLVLLSNYYNYYWAKNILYVFEKIGESLFFLHSLPSWWWWWYNPFLIHSANPQSWPVVITIFAHISLRPYKLSQNKTKIATGGTVGLAEWIIDDTCLVLLWSRGDFRYFILFG